jgi:anti-sigma-K factor RskA
VNRLRGGDVAAGGRQQQQGPARIEGHDVNDRTHEALKELLPAYALGALDAEDARFVEAHLSTYPDCERELVELQDSLAMLAFSVPAATPPPGVKAALLDRVGQGAPGRDAALRRLSGTPESAAAEPAPAPVRALPATRSGGRGWRVALAALAAVLVLGLLSWGTILQLRLRDERQQLAAERQRNDALAAQTMELAFINKLLNDPYAAHPVIGPTVADYGLPAAGFIYTDPQSTTALMLTYWLPSLGPDQRFQLWLYTPDGQRDNGGLFRADAHGNAHVVIHAPATFAKYQSVSVTIEPATGSSWPTGAKVCGGNVR